MQLDLRWKTDSAPMPTAIVAGGFESLSVMSKALNMSLKATKSSKERLERSKDFSIFYLLFNVFKQTILSAISCTSGRERDRNENKNEADFFLAKKFKIDIVKLSVGLRR